MRTVAEPAHVHHLEEATETAPASSYQAGMGAQGHQIIQFLKRARNSIFYKSPSDFLNIGN